VQELNGDVTESADADDDDGRSGTQARKLGLDRVVRRERGVVSGAARTGSRSPIGTSSRGDGTST
jgi:hypothetical protein